jgi:hypothetical protein
MASGFVEKSAEIDQRPCSHSRLFLESHLRAHRFVEHPLRELDAATVRFVLAYGVDDEVTVPASPSTHDQASAVQCDPAIPKLENLVVVGSVAWASFTRTGPIKASAAAHRSRSTTSESRVPPNRRSSIEAARSNCAYASTRDADSYPSSS